MKAVQESLPLNLKALHYFYDNAMMRLLLLLVVMAMGKHARSGLRIHYGSAMECQYALLTFGIPALEIPINSKGDVDARMTRAHHQRWLGQLCARERERRMRLGM